MRAKLLFIALLLLCRLAGAQSFSVMDAVAPITGSQPQGAWYAGNVTIRNLGEPFDSATVIDMPTARNIITYGGSYLPRYAYTFEMADNATGVQTPAFAVFGFSDLTGPSGDYVFPTGADHSFAMMVQASYSVTGNRSYTLYFRAYDTVCPFTYGVDLNDPRCLVYQLPIHSTAISWIAPNPPPPPPPQQTLYPMLTKRPAGNPPATYPVSTFLTCTSSGCY